MPVSFLLVHKGMVRDGWKLHWKPAFRVQALNGLLELTTNHSVFPYLWKGELESQDETSDEKDKEESGSKNAPDQTLGTTLAEKARRLGLKTVCQWEFVSTTNGEIIYERALDREGRMVYGLIYSPPGSGSPLIGLTRIVGPNGFPQLQRTSAAEYVEIHYNEAGWEDRVMYRDSKGLPAAGPDGAFGRNMQYDSRGRLTGVVSLDANGQRMIDTSGNCGMEAKYDNTGWEVEEMSVGPDLKPMPLKDGYVIAKMQYDQYGRLEQTTFHGLKGEPVVLKKSGYHGFQAKYDAHGNQSVGTYLGKDGKPMSIDDGYATLKTTYDSRGKPTRISFYGVMGEPVLPKKYGYHASETKYDEHGNDTLMTFLDKDGKPIDDADGYATMRSAYDARGNLIRVTFQDANGEPALSKKNGYYGCEAEYDEQGNKIVSTYLGKDGKPMPGTDGYATLRMAYDSRGNVNRVTLHGANGEAVKSEANGYYGLEAEYDERGNRIVTTTLGKDGKPMPGADGYATMKSTYDARGNENRETFYDVNGKPVRHKDGDYGRAAEYDEHGNKVVVTYFDKDGKPMSVADGYATHKWAYNSRGNMVRETFYGVNGEPVLSKKNGYYGLEADYDKHGNPTIVTYIGPTAVADGYATLKMAYDSRGKVIHQTFYGVNGEPVQHKVGYYGWEAEYDEQGNQIVQTYLGNDGRPMPCADGYVTLRLAYDSRGNVIRVTYHAANGDAVKSTKDGYYGWEAKYDEQGNKTVAYLDKDGKRIAGKEP
jgi:YD repeat-containing protein